jgi:hypothetical protein
MTKGNAWLGYGGLGGADKQCITTVIAGADEQPHHGRHSLLRVTNITMLNVGAQHMLSIHCVPTGVLLAAGFGTRVGHHHTCAVMFCHHPDCFCY